MMDCQTGDQSQLFYLFNLEGRIPERHLLRRINPLVTRVLGTGWATRANEALAIICTPPKRSMVFGSTMSAHATVGRSTADG
jgi:hypothetical protein